jgi:hypothetical protein
MRRNNTAVAARAVQTLALLVAAGLIGCRGAGSSSIPMPRKIVDLSPLITEDLPVRQLGHRACNFLGLKERLTFTPVTPSKEAYAFGLTYFG